MSERTPYIFSAVIVILAAVAFYWLDSYGRNSRVYGRAGLLDDGRVEKIFVATPQEAYLFWKKKGVRGRAVVYVGEKWARFDPSQYNEPPLYRSYPLKLYNLAQEQERSHLSAENFLYFAALDGVARQINGVLAEPGFSEISAQAQMAKNVRFDKEAIFLTHQGFPRTFSTARHFRAASEPALLYVGAEYFRENEPDELYRQLLRSGLITDFVILCTQAGAGSVSAAERAKLERFAGLIGMKGRP